MKDRYQNYRVGQTIWMPREHPWYIKLWCWLTGKTVKKQVDKLTITSNRGDWIEFRVDKD